MRGHGTYKSPVPPVGLVSLPRTAHDAAGGCTMGKDFRIGLIVGLTLAVIALIWVATRPSLSPEARMRRPSHAANSPSSNGAVPWDEIAAPQQTSDQAPPAEPPPREPAVTIPVSNPPTAMPDPAPKQVASPTHPEAPPIDPNLPDLTVYETDTPIETTRFHIVQRGESLSGIALQYYGSPNAWQKILKANPKTINDPDKITPGTKLIIPR